jgi:hypothetical protein
MGFVSRGRRKTGRGAYRSYTFEQWIGFLQGTGLITIAPNGNYVLTTYGRGLLQYVLNEHLPTNKPF